MGMIWRTSLAAFLTALVLLPLIGRWASSKGIVNAPKGPRWSERDVPLLGGLGLLLSAGAGLALSGAGKGVWLPCFAPAFILLLLGLADDLRGGLTFQAKVGGQVLAALMAVGLGLYPRGIPTGVAVPLTVVWLVAFVNSFNIMDNMDGVAGGLAAISAAGFLLILAKFPDAEATALSAAVLGASVGYLVHNFPPARIFMGDAGSLPLGFLLAVLTVKVADAAFARVGARGAVAPFIVLGPFIFDTALVSFSRLRRGRPLYVGGRDHTSHRLAWLFGGNERRALAVMYAAGACFCGLAFWVVHTLWALPLTGAAFLSGALLAAVLRVNPDEDRKGGER